MVEISEFQGLCKRCDSLAGINKFISSLCIMKRYRQIPDPGPTADPHLVLVSDLFELEVSYLL
jgi:hypothetical protein